MAEKILPVAHERVRGALLRRAQPPAVIDDPHDALDGVGGVKHLQRIAVAVGEVLHEQLVAVHEVAGDDRAVPHVEAIGNRGGDHEPEGVDHRRPADDEQGVERAENPARAALVTGISDEVGHVSFG
ncbi:MAG: hypothetical protein WCK73_11350 [Deltaproteobacteria bacterium]